MVQEINAAVAPTLPPWIWVCYYFCIAIGLALTVMHILTGSNHPRERMFNLFNLMFLLSVPVIFLVNSIGQNGTEYGNFLTALQKGESWTLFVLGGYVYVFIRTSIIVKILRRQYKQKNGRKLTL